MHTRRVMSSYRNAAPQAGARRPGKTGVVPRLRDGDRFRRDELGHGSIDRARRRRRYHRARRRGRPGNRAPFLSFAGYNE